ncbi:hypothetical protein C2E23DRAFT_820174 [Lenzites betulinus]|nr:hypothetical protein C2E23DRAFT_820174 [Lenzites betulinus]
MSHYLRGSGHPIHPALEGVISPERYHAEEGDAALRATLLLQTMTASPLQPVGESWKLMFAFAHAHQDASLGARPEVIQMPSPIVFQSCFKRALVTMDAPLHNLLLEPEPSTLDGSTLFHAWMHASLLLQDDFNMA